MVEEVAEAVEVAELVADMVEVSVGSLVGLEDGVAGPVAEGDPLGDVDAVAEDVADAVARQQVQKRDGDGILLVMPRFGCQDRRGRGGGGVPVDRCVSERGAERGDVGCDE